MGKYGEKAPDDADAGRVGEPVCKDSAKAWSAYHGSPGWKFCLPGLDMFVSCQFAIFAFFVDLDSFYW